MARHILEIVYTPEEIKALGSAYGAANAEIRKNAPSFPLPRIGFSPNSRIDQFQDTTRDFGVTTKKCPFKILMYSSATSDGKDTLNIYTVCE
jgi:hypothetical protein